MSLEGESPNHADRARAELEESQRNMTRTEAVIVSVTKSMGIMRERTDRNHFAEAMRRTIQRKGAQ